MELPALLSRYLLAPAAEQTALRTSHAHFFSDGVDDALREARAQMRDAQQAARAATSAVDGLAESLDLPDKLSLCDAERRALGLTDEAMAQRFAEQIALLLRQRENESAARPPPPPPPPLWHRERSIVFAILSFLPVEATLSVAENVCGPWRQWLGEPVGAKAFWNGCVQREFPWHLRALLESEGAELFEADWRTVAMLCCTAEGESESEEDA